MDMVKKDTGTSAPGQAWSVAGIEMGIPPNLLGADLAGKARSRPGHSTCSEWGGPAIDSGTRRVFDDMTITLSSKEPNGVPFRRWERKVTSIVLLISSSVVLGSIGPGMGCCWGECLFV